MSKKQITLHNFLKNKDNDNIKEYFYLLWENKFKPNVEAYLTHKCPEKINFIEKINCDYIKKDYFFYICGYFTDYDEKYNLQKETTYNNIHYLESHLQKCIRKQNDILSIPTALHMMKLNINIKKH